MDRDAKIYVAGHRGLVGAAVLARLRAEGFRRIVTRDHAGLDLTRQKETEEFFSDEAPEAVILAAARVGGILANLRYKADFIRDNLLIQTNVIEAARRSGVGKLVFLGSSCIYPRLARQPINEDQLLAGPLEETNDAYAIAKIAGIKMIQSYREQYGCRGISLMPTNLYGPGDNFDLEDAHVLPALMRKFHEAKLADAPEVVVWGSGKPRREFLHVDDLASAVVFLLESYDSPEIINVGCGRDTSIAELAELIRETVGFQGRIVYDRTKPDGTPRKLLDVSKITGLGWKPRIDLAQGLAATYEWFRNLTAQ